MDDDQLLENQDLTVYEALAAERRRQAQGLELIPSENYVSRAVLAALGSEFTNKYAEGYPGERYYGGQENTDKIEKAAIKRAKNLFGARFANVQPHSGAPANWAVYFALLEPGDTVLSMDLSHGGHLTHGSPATHLTDVFNFVHYKISDVDTGAIDYDEMRQIAQKEKPQMVLAGFSSYPRELDYEEFVSIAKDVGAVSVIDIAHIAGLIAGGAVDNPFDYGFDVMTSTTHKTLRGPRGGIILTRDDKDIAQKIDKSVFPGLQGGPHMNNIAAKAVCFREAESPEFQEYVYKVIGNAQAMAEVFAESDIRLITGGTDNHMLLADVSGSLQLPGKGAQSVLEEVGITLNMNVIPDDPRQPRNPSGIRFGTPALTTREFTKEECAEVARLMVKVLKNPEDRHVKSQAKTRVQQMANQHPIPNMYIT